MKAAILSIGTEISRGELTNTNASWLAEQLTSLGFTVEEQSVIDDDIARVVSALDRLATSADVIVCTGGLGPTTDDLTALAVAQWANVPLERDEAALEAIRERFLRFKRTMSASNEKQADLPKGCLVLPNAEGTAPGFAVTKGATTAYFMPGVPREMKRMFERLVTPELTPRVKRTSSQIRLRTFGLPESLLGERLTGIEPDHPGVILGYRAHFPEIEVKVLARAEDEQQSTALAEKVAEVVRARLGDVIYGGETDSYAQVTLRELAARGHTLAVAESCTGGLVGHMLTKVSGASEVFVADVVAYANQAKTEFLGVPEALLSTHGAVSEEVVRSMAEGMRKRSGATVSVALTGIAGPSGGTAEKPVGTVYIATSTTQQTVADRLHFPWHREFVQSIAAYVALKMAREASAELVDPGGS